MSGRERALIVVGKAPLAGATKTRLIPPLAADEAAELYAAFVRDAVDLALGMGWECVSVVHADTSGARATLAELLPREVRLLAQPGRGLESALRYAFTWHFERWFEKVVVIGSDSPTLPPDVLSAADAGLDVADVVIGPSMDGGYYLLGMAHWLPALFDDITWSTERVLAETLARAAGVGARVEVLREWYDVDRPADLERLAAELRTGTPAAPWTRAALGRLGYVVGRIKAGERPDRLAYALQSRAATSAPEPGRATSNTAPPKPPPVSRAP